MRHQPTRRGFLQSAAIGGAALALAGSRSAAAAPAQVKPTYCAFTKPLQKLSFDELAERIAELGFDGIEAPVRPGGHIEPERVEDELPKLVEALASRGLTIPILTSGVTSVDQPHTAKVLTTAAKLGIPLYRMAYYKYDLNQPVAKQLDELKPVIRDLVAFSREVGISPIYQNHSGRELVGAPLWDLHDLMRDHPPEDIGVAFDLGHATAEGGMSWPIQVNLLRPRMRALYVKDFQWRKSKLDWVPLGEGRSDPKFYQQMRWPNFQGPLSVHVEYLDHKRDATVEEFLAAFKHDLDQLKTWQQA
ncbi:MAG: sugar phosphate isomerase/epimerase family protein [Pirellulales bacterium]